MKINQFSMLVISQLVTGCKSAGCLPPNTCSFDLVVNDLGSVDHAGNHRVKFQVWVGDSALETNDKAEALSLGEVDPPAEG